MAEKTARETIARSLSPRAWQRGYTSPNLKAECRQKADAILAALAADGFAVGIAKVNVDG